MKRFFAFILFTLSLPLITLAGDIQFPVVTSSGTTTTVQLPANWSVVSVQRHAVPLYTEGALYENSEYSKARVLSLSKAIDKESMRVSKLYTVTFSTPEGFVTASMELQKEYIKWVTPKFYLR
jgi:hypothetical protein